MTATAAPSLIRSIGPFQLTLYGLGSMLGSGIYGLINFAMTRLQAFDGISRL